MSDHRKKERNYLESRGLTIMIRNKSKDLQKYIKKSLVEQNFS